MRPETQAEALARKYRDIYARFNQLLTTGQKIQVIYEQIGWEFYLTARGAQNIVLKMQKK